MRDSLRESSLNDQMKVGYLMMVDHSGMDQKYKENMLNLLNMGFTDFHKNLDLLQNNNNNLEIALQKMFYQGEDLYD